MLGCQLRFHAYCVAECIRHSQVPGLRMMEVEVAHLYKQRRFRWAQRQERPASTGGSGCMPMAAGMTSSRSSRGRWASCRTSLAAELVHKSGGMLHISTPGQCGVDAAMWGDTNTVRCMSPESPAAAAAGCLARQPCTRSALHMHCASHQQTPCECRVHIPTTGQEHGTRANRDSPQTHSMSTVSGHAKTLRSAPCTEQ